MCTLYRSFLYHKLVKYIVAHQWFYQSIHLSVWVSMCALCICVCICCMYTLYISRYYTVYLCWVYIWCMYNMYGVYAILSICPFVHPFVLPSIHSSVPIRLHLYACACVLCVYIMYKYFVCIYNHSQNIWEKI